MEIQRYKALLARDDPDKPWTNTPREVVLYADHLATIAALTADLKIANGGIRTLDEMMELREKHIDALTAERDEYEKWGNEVRLDSAATKEWCERLTAENDRLREALEYVRVKTAVRTGHEPWEYYHDLMLELSRVAQAALKQEGGV